MKKIALITCGLLLLFPVFAWTWGGGRTAANGPDHCNLYGAVYIEETESFADYKVFVEDVESFADLVVFKEQTRGFADAPGLWYITDVRGFADFTVAWTDVRGFADFSVFFTDFKSVAGCGN